MGYKSPLIQKPHSHIIGQAQHYHDASTWHSGQKEFVSVQVSQQVRQNTTLGTRKRIVCYDFHVQDKEQESLGYAGHHLKL